MASLSAVLLLLFAILEAVGAQRNISLGSSLSPTTQRISWPSQSGRFGFGFYEEGNGFLIGIWLVRKYPGNIIVWTANRNDQPVSSNSRLDLTKDGKLVVITGQGEANQPIPIANSSESASSASMLDNGNFVLYDKNSNVIWQTFDHPTNTILGGQRLSAGGALISTRSATNHSTGRFSLKMQGDGNLVLYPIDGEDSSVYAYWSTGTLNTNRIIYLYLNSTGPLLLLNLNNSVTIRVLVNPSSSLHNNSTIYRATLDDDGIFRWYSHGLSNGESTLSSFEVSKSDNPCDVKGSCGFNSICTSNGQQVYCDCVPGTTLVDPDQHESGCKRNLIKGSCEGGKEIASTYTINATENLTWIEPPYFKALMSEEDCRQSCLEDCNCEVALFTGEYCMKNTLPLRHVTKSDPTQASTMAFFKLGTRSINSTLPKTKRTITRMSKEELLQILAVNLSLVACSCATLAISGFFLLKARDLRHRRLLENGSLGLTKKVSLQSFSYKVLRKATNGFRDELGKGSFGAVYKGALYKGKKPVAVKRLEKVVEEGEREFRTEMRSIGRTHHKNLVRLIGYCAEHSKRLLVYEYMSNGTLADLLFKGAIHPDWNERVRIALDVARGILYLHEECEAPIIHCDIKPSNILMDEFWRAKISDFGLAKLLLPDQTRTITMVRGTRGYLAPEWHKNSPISVKADIYSYGIVLMEIICCRRNVDVNVSKPDEIALYVWIYKCFVAGELSKLVRGEEVDKNSLENMVKVALWCVQDEPPLRPSMKSVVLMLEGITDTPIPPCPSTTSM